MEQSIETQFNNSVLKRIPDMQIYGDILTWLATGLIEEATEVLSIIRRAKFTSPNTSIPPIIVLAIQDKLGDLLFYTHAIMMRLGINKDQVMEYNNSKLEGRAPGGTKVMEEQWSRFIKKLEEKYERDRS